MKKKDLHIYLLNHKFLGNIQLKIKIKTHTKVEVQWKNLITLIDLNPNLSPIGTWCFLKSEKSSKVLAFLSFRLNKPLSYDFPPLAL